MIHAYKITDGIVNYLGASDKHERLIKALTMADIDIEGIQFTETEPVSVGGKYFLSAEDEEYLTLKAEEEAEQKRLASLPTPEQRIAFLEAENESMNDMMLGLVEVIDNM